MNFKKILYQQCAYYFLSHDYQLNYPKNQFLKATASGNQRVFIHVSVNKGEAIVDLHLCVRLEEVENLAFKFTNGLLDLRSESQTAIISIGKCLGDPTLRLKAKTEEEMTHIAESLIQFMDDKGEKQLKLMSDPESLEKLINQNPEEVNPYVHNQAHRVFKGLILSKSLKKDNFEALSIKYRYFLEKRKVPKSVLENLSLLIEQLKKADFGKAS